MSMGNGTNAVLLAMLFVAGRYSERCCGMPASRARTSVSR